MKIGIDGRLLNKTHNTGISRYTEFLLEYYIKRYNSKNVFVITNDKLLVIDDCQIIYTKLKPYNICHFLYYENFVATFHFDIFHVPFYSGFFIKHKHAKVIVTVHDLMYKLVDDFFGTNKVINFLKLKYFDFIVQNTVRNADTVVSVSETTQRDLYDFFKIDSRCIPENSEVSSDSDEDILGKLGVKAKQYFFYCGNNRPHKNLQVVIDIFNKLSDLPPLVLAGKGHQGSKNIVVAGVVTENELRALYESAIAFIFPSKYEGFGLPILEALSLRTPVIASRIPAFLEFNNNNIFYFDNPNQLVIVLRNITNHQFIVDRSFFEKYSSSEIYKLLDSLLEE